MQHSSISLRRTDGRTDVIEAPVGRLSTLKVRSKVDIMYAGDRIDQKSSFIMPTAIEIALRPLALLLNCAVGIPNDFDDKTEEATQLDVSSKRSPDDRDRFEYLWKRHDAAASPDM